MIDIALKDGEVLSLNAHHIAAIRIRQFRRRYEYVDPQVTNFFRKLVRLPPIRPHKRRITDHILSCFAVTSPAVIIELKYNNHRHIICRSNKHAEDIKKYILSEMEKKLGLLEPF